MTDTFKHDDLPCDHGLKFDATTSDKLTCHQVRSFYPRLDGRCPKGCGYVGIAYVSTEHFVAGDW